MRLANLKSINPIRNLSKNARLVRPMTSSGSAGFFHNARRIIDSKYSRPAEGLCYENTETRRISSRANRLDDERSEHLGFGPVCGQGCQNVLERLFASR